MARCHQVGGMEGSAAGAGGDHHVGEGVEEDGGVGVVVEDGEGVHGGGDAAGLRQDGGGEAPRQDGEDGGVVGGGLRLGGHDGHGALTWDMGKEQLPAQ